MLHEPGGNPDLPDDASIFTPALGMAQNLAALSLGIQSPPLVS